MGNSNVPIRPLLMEICGRTVVVFWWFWGCGTSDTQLARRKLAKKTHPNHGGRRRPTAAMVPPPPVPPHTTISQHAMRQGDVVKTRVYICFYYLLAIQRYGASWRRVVLLFVEGFFLFIVKTPPT
jgi:hypothetical protein